VGAKIKRKQFALRLVYSRRHVRVCYNRARAHAYTYVIGVRLIVDDVVVHTYTIASR
jgi:hypothetical protein